MILSVAFPLGVGEDRGILYRRELPEIAREDHIDASERSGVLLALHVSKRIRMSHTSFLAKERFQGCEQRRRQTAGFVNDQPAEREGLVPYFDILKIISFTHDTFSFVGFVELC